VLYLAQRPDAETPDRHLTQATLMEVAMPARLDITNQRFGRLVALQPTGRDQSGWWWLCICDCGKQTVVRGVVLRRNDTKSCGCSMRESKTRHGHIRRHDGRKTVSPTYVTWYGMLTRCRNSKQRSYADYGGRGIAVCERWLAFENFLSDMGERPPGSSLDRINNNSNYEPGNCRWANYKEQAANQRRRRKLLPNDVTAIRNDRRYQYIIAAEYDISTSLVSKIKSRKN
jgi:hypothetical protein